MDLLTCCPSANHLTQKRTAAFDEDKQGGAESNLSWIQRWRADSAAFFGAGDVILLGGSSLTDFRIRIAQSHARHDLTPSYWSLVGIVDANDQVLTAPLWPLLEPDRVPMSNGIQSIPLSTFDDPAAWPNIGVIRFPGVQQDPVDCVTRLREQRSIIDIPTLILPWLGFVWGAGAAGNPLLNGFGLPSAVLVETAFGIAEVELTPGLAAASSCPEAIYQAARWWSRLLHGDGRAPDDRDASAAQEGRGAADPSGWPIPASPATGDVRGTEVGRIAAQGR